MNNLNFKATFRVKKSSNKIESGNSNTLLIKTKRFDRKVFSNKNLNPRKKKTERRLLFIFKKKYEKIFNFFNFATLVFLFFMAIQGLMNYEAFAEKLKFSVKTKEEKNTLIEKYENIINDKRSKTEKLKFKKIDKDIEIQSENKKKWKKNLISKFSKAIKTKRSKGSRLKMPQAPSMILPWDSRLIIPKIGKNVPIIFPSIENLRQGEMDEFKTDILKGLKEGVIHYPGTAKPGEEGNVFITGHSSYYPWDDGKYKDVFVLLDELEVNDEFTILYGQKDFHYKIFDKSVVNSADVDVMNQGSGEMVTLMTCWPIGTNLKRLILRAYSTDKF